MDKSEQLMTQEELAFRWQISEATLERERSMKRGCQYLKIGGLIRYKIQDVFEYENACTHKPKDDNLKE
jgi:DNA-binding XRE family transcriptional regulator